MKCTSNKKSFETEHEANEWIKVWNTTHAKSKALSYCYICNECGLWHMTSSAKLKLSQLQRLKKRVLDQNAIIEQNIIDIDIFRRDIIHIKKQIHDKDNHLHALLKTNKLILEKLKEM